MSVIDYMGGIYEYVANNYTFQQVRDSFPQSDPVILEAAYNQLVVMRNEANNNPTNFGYASTTDFDYAPTSNFQNDDYSLQQQVPTHMYNSHNYDGLMNEQNSLLVLKIAPDENSKIEQVSSYSNNSTPTNPGPSTTFSSGPSTVFPVVTSTGSGPSTVFPVVTSTPTPIGGGPSTVFPIVTSAPTPTTTGDGPSTVFPVVTSTPTPTGGGPKTVFPAAEEIKLPVSEEVKPTAAVSLLPTENLDLSCAITSAATVNIKVFLPQEENRRVRYPGKDLKNLSLILPKFCAFDPDLQKSKGLDQVKLYYRDEDKDWVRVTSDADWIAALQLHLPFATPTTTICLKVDTVDVVVIKPAVVVKPAVVAKPAVVVKPAVVKPAVVKPAVVKPATPVVAKTATPKKNSVANPIIGDPIIEPSKYEQQMIIMASFGLMDLANLADRAKALSLLNKYDGNLQTTITQWHKSDENY